MTDTLDDVFVAAQAAKAAYREEQTGETREAHKAAAEELRYVRWVARGGPSIPEEDRTPVDVEFHARWTEEG